MLQVPWQDVFDQSRRDSFFVLPEAILAFFGLGTLLLDFLLTKSEKLWNSLTAMIGVIMSSASLFVMLREMKGQSYAAFGNSIIIDPFFIFFGFIFLASTALVILISVKYMEIEREQHGEYYALMLFATVGPGTPVWLIVLQASCYGACTSLQYTSMNTMVYEDIDENQKSSAGSLASMAQELSISFGVAAAGFTTAFFMLDRFRPNPGDMMIAPCQQAFLILGAFTILSTFIFRRLKSENGTERHPKGLSLTEGAPA